MELAECNKIERQISRDLMCEFKDVVYLETLIRMVASRGWGLGTWGDTH